MKLETWPGEIHAVFVTPFNERTTEVDEIPNRLAILRIERPSERRRLTALSSTVFVRPHFPVLAILARTPAVTLSLIMSQLRHLKNGNTLELALV